MEILHAAYEKRPGRHPSEVRDSHKRPLEVWEAAHLHPTNVASLEVPAEPNVWVEYQTAAVQMLLVIWGGNSEFP